MGASYTNSRVMILYTCINNEIQITSKFSIYCLEKFLLKGANQWAVPMNKNV